jgi:hypothetical protein
MKACINLDTNEVMVELNDGDKFGSGKVYIGSSIIIRGKFSDKVPPSKVSERFHIGMIRPDFWMWRAFMESVNRYWGRVFLCVRTEEE